MSEPIGVLEVKLGGILFLVWFHDQPDLNALSQPVNGPAHNRELSGLLQMLKRKSPESMQDEDGEIIDDHDQGKCRRWWLAELKVIETSLGDQLRKKLWSNPGEYLTA